MVKLEVKVIVAILLVFFFMILGTLLFHRLENWSYIDSFYFTGITLTTVGYGDLTPLNPISKILSVIFAFAGIGLVFYAVSIISQNYFSKQEERFTKLREKLQKRRESKQ